MHQNRTDFWRSLILDLRLHTTDEQNLLATLDLLNPAHGLRAAMVSPLRQQVERALGPAAAQRFKAYDDALPKIGFFSFMPVIEVAVRHHKAGQLLYPDQPLIPTVNEIVRQNVVSLRDAPFMQAIIRAAEGDPLVFLRNNAGNNQTIENYGDRELEIAKPGHVLTIYRDYYPLFAQYYVVGSSHAILGWFNRPCEVTFEILSDTDCAVDIRW